MRRILRAASSDHWRTPPDLFAALDREFTFQVDLAANAENHLLSVYLGEGGQADDALSTPWAEVARFGFLNPPYSAALVKRFVDKAAAEAMQGFTTVALLKYDPSTQWWEATRTATEIREIQGRVPFLKADGSSAGGAMFPSAVVVWRPQPGIVRAQPRRVTWTWR